MAKIRYCRVDECEYYCKIAGMLKGTGKCTKQQVTLDRTGHCEGMRLK